MAAPDIEVVASSKQVCNFSFTVEGSMRYMVIRLFVLVSLLLPVFASAVPPTVGDVEQTVIAATVGVSLARGAPEERDRMMQTFVDAFEVSGAEKHMQSIHQVHLLEGELPSFSATDLDSLRMESQTVLLDGLHIARRNAAHKDTASKSAVRTLTSQSSASLSATMSPANYDFGNVNIGSSPSTTVVITNTGNGTLTFSAGYPMTDALINPGTVMNGTTCMASLAPGQSCSVSVSFAPKSSGSYSAWVASRFNETSDLFFTNLSGYGVSGVIAPFNVSLTAPANLSQVVDSVTYSGHVTGSTGTSISFALTLGSGNPVLTAKSTSQSCVNSYCDTSFSVTFVWVGGSVLPGDRIATLVVTDSQGRTVNVDRTLRVISGVPTVSFSPASLSFLTQAQGTSSTTQTIALTNTGSAALSLSSIAASGDFSQINNCGSALAAGGVCNISVTFTPTAAGTRTGAVTITSNAAGSPHSVSLAGIGAAGYALNLSKSGTGSGTLVSSPSGINCGALCSAVFTSGTSVTLSVTAAADSTFVGWSGGGCSGTGFCTVSMSQARTVTATFTANANTLTVSKAGTGLGLVSSPAGSGLYCGTVCIVAYPGGTSVTLTATATTGSTFAGWSGDCSGTSTCTVSMNQAHSVSATFTLVSVSSASPYDGIYQWDTGYFLSVHQIGGGALIASIYWVYDANTEQVGTRAIAAADTFDLLQGQIVGSSATISGTRFYRACTLSYDFTFNLDASLTVRLNSVSNSPGVSVADVDCAARYNTVGSVWTIPRIY